MTNSKINITDQRMFELAEHLKSNKLIDFKQRFWDAIGIKKQAISNIRSGGQHFTLKHIVAACKKYDVDANWILGLSNTNPFMAQTKPQTKS